MQDGGTCMLNAYDIGKPAQAQSRPHLTHSMLCSRGSGLPGSRLLPDRNSAVISSSQTYICYRYLMAGKPAAVHSMSHPEMPLNALSAGRNL